MDVLLLATVLITGFVGCAEFGSVALVHPAVRGLDADHQLVMEKGLLRTFGRVMPLGMTAAPILTGSLAARSGSGWLAAATCVLSVALIVTILGNVPINIRTARLPTGPAPMGFSPMRRRWDVYQAVRGTLQLLGFMLVALEVASS